MEQLTAVCPKCGGTRFKVIPHPDRKDRISGATCIKCNYFLSPLEVVEISENQQGIPLDSEQKPS
jgi:ssDNA-binding Zn-finger/Zn-ribbon topoisomerase 1